MSNPLHLLTDPGPLLGAAGLIGLVGIVFAETGLLIGFLLPGDSLLFTAGLLARQPHGFAPLWLVCLLTPLAAFAGDQVGYTIGRRLGPSVMRSRTVQRMGPGAVERAEQFFAEHGPKTVLLARFVPVVRTLVPTMAGTVRMERGVFTRWNAVGAVLWGAGVPLIGAALGGIPSVRAHIEMILLAVVVSLLPVLGHALSLRRHPAAPGPEPAADPGAAVPAETPCGAGTVTGASPSGAHRLPTRPHL